MRKLAAGGWRRLAKLSWVPVVGLVLAACGYEDKANNTGDTAAPNTPWGAQENL